MKEQTANKVPQIRFKGFEGNWKESALAVLTDVRDGTHTSPHYYSKGHPLITSKNVSDGFINYRDVQYISENDFHEINKRSKVDISDILMGMIGTIGNTALVRKNPDFAIKNVALIKSVGRIDENYLYQYMQTKLFTTRLSDSAEGGTQKFISLTKIRELLVGTTEKAEQAQIGKYFRELDHLIGLHQRKHDKLGTLKKAMLQKMFPQAGTATPEIRFKGFEGDWVKRKLGECVLIQRGGSPRPIESFITQDANGINWVKIGDVKVGSRYITKTEEKIKPAGVSKSREVFIGDLILSNSMSFGRPYLMAIDGCIHDGWLLIRNDRNLFDLNYLLQLLSSETMVEQYRSLAAGGVVINLNSALVQSTNISFPEKPEQQKIGTYFRQLDTLITQHASQLQKLKQIKSACLQKMFV